MKKLNDYEQVPCPYCSGKVILRAYLDPPGFYERIYKTSYCPKHGNLFMRPELVRKIKLKKKNWLTIQTGLQ